VNRVETSAVLHAVREPPRAPVLEIPRPLGAGVGVCFYDFELCSECGSKLVEHNGLLVCSARGLAATPVYEPPQLNTRARRCRSTATWCAPPFWISSLATSATLAAYTLKSYKVYTREVCVARSANRKRAPSGS